MRSDERMYCSKCSTLMDFIERYRFNTAIWGFSGKSEGQDVYTLLTTLGHVLETNRAL